MNSMNDAHKLEIASLAAIVFERRQRLDRLGMMNANADPETARQNSMAYAVAQADLMNAQRDLNAAMERAK